MAIGAVVGQVADRDAGRAGRRQVDVVEADPHPDQQPAPSQPPEVRAPHLRGGANKAAGRGLSESPNAAAAAKRMRTGPRSAGASAATRGAPETLRA